MDVRSPATKQSFGQVRPDRCTRPWRSQHGAISLEPVSSPAWGFNLGDRGKAPAKRLTAPLKKFGLGPEAKRPNSPTIKMFARGAKSMKIAMKVEQ